MPCTLVGAENSEEGPDGEDPDEPQPAVITAKAQMPALTAYDCRRSFMSMLLEVAGHKVVPRSRRRPIEHLTFS